MATSVVGLFLTVLSGINGEKRTIPMNQRLFELLKAKAKVMQGGSHYVFASEAGTKILRRNLMRSFYNVRDRARMVPHYYLESTVSKICNCCGIVQFSKRS
jgi:integrase